MIISIFSLDSSYLPPHQGRVRSKNKLASRESQYIYLVSSNNIATPSPLALPVPSSPLLWGDFLFFSADSSVIDNEDSFFGGFRGYLLSWYSSPSHSE